MALLWVFIKHHVKVGGCEFNYQVQFVIPECFCRESHRDKIFN